jgi:2-polyprenyl-6-methoxyphenol hydroxylase-like FAD-dependent oxidoreductase
MNPSGGAGAITAIHDAVTLANWLSTLQTTEGKEIEEVFRNYRAERYPVAKAAFEVSQMFTRNLGKVISRYTA